VEPVAGVELMRRRRPAATRVVDLACGPGRLTLAMGITRALNGSSLVSGPLQVRTPEKEEPFEVDVTPRIGITKCADWPLRFLIRGNRCGRMGKSNAY
jgi:DNA-3-methyladenine glycosylase